MAAMTASEITIKNSSVDNLGIIPESFRRLGITIEQSGGDDLYIPRHDGYTVGLVMDRFDSDYCFMMPWQD